MKFSELNLHENIMKGIADAGFEECMPVQAATFTHTLNGTDVLVQSQTGTGKTVAFLISIYQLMLTDDRYKDGKALIIVPTRELAVQIEDEAKLIGAHLPLRIGSFYGGVGYNQQDRLLEKGVDIMIGTPGRLLDYSNSNKINFEEVKILVIDEADRLFDMGFYPDLRRMLRQMVPARKRMTMLYSATLGNDVKRLSSDYMNEPEEITIAPEKVTVELVTQRLYHVGRSEKFRLLLGILKKENPNNALIFTNTKRAAVEIAKRLEYNGYPCEFIMGDLPQSKRLKIIDDIKDGKIRFLVATNVAARGLHIDDLDLVVNYDLPQDEEDYVHRIGRTARAGKSGMAISLACPEFVYSLEAIEDYTKMKIPVEWPDESLFAEDKSKGVRMAPLRDKRDRDRGRGDRPRGDRKRRRDEKPAARREHARPAERAPHKKRETAEEPGREPRAHHEKRDRHAARAEGDTTQRDAKAKRPRRKRGGKKKSTDERLEQYREKYGEDFTVKNETHRASRKDGTDKKRAQPEKSKKGILDRIKGIFGKKKK